MPKPRSRDCTKRTSLTKGETRYVAHEELLEYLQHRFGCDRKFGEEVSPQGTAHDDLGQTARLMLAATAPPRLLDFLRPG